MIDECKNRCEIMQQNLLKKGFDGALIMDRVSLFYYFGTIPGGYGYIPTSDEPVLLVRRGADRARRESTIPVHTSPSFRTMKSFFEERGWAGHDKIGLEFNRVPLNLYHLLIRHFSDTEFLNISPMISTQRAVKSDCELAILREAGKRAAESFRELPELLSHPQITELEVMAEFEAVMRKREHQGLVRLHAFNGEIYYGAFASGVSANANISFDGPVGTPGLSAAAPFLCSTKPINRNEPIVIDVVFGYQGYNVDQTRIYVVGSIPEKLIKAFDCSLRIQDEVVRSLKPGVLCNDLYEKSLEIALDEGLSNEFMGFGDNQVSFIGHGVGLELDELPVLTPKYKQPLQNNMVVALEPKFFFAELGGVGIENTFIVTDEGGEKLTPLDDSLITLP